MTVSQECKCSADTVFRSQRKEEIVQKTTLEDRGTEEIGDDKIKKSGRKVNGECLPGLTLGCMFRAGDLLHQLYSPLSFNLS